VAAPDLQEPSRYYDERFNFQIPNSRPRPLSPKDNGLPEILDLIKRKDLVPEYAARYHRGGPS
jgi:hypothetical protein